MLYCLRDKTNIGELAKRYCAAENCANLIGVNENNLVNVERKQHVEEENLVAARTHTSSLVELSI